MPLSLPFRERNFPSPSVRCRSVWVLALLAMAGCQSIGLPTQWGAGHVPAATESTTETASKPTASVDSKAEGEAPELVARLRPLLADGNWSLDPAWSLLDATTDPRRFGPAFAQVFAGDSFPRRPSWKPLPHR